MNIIHTTDSLTEAAAASSTWISVLIGLATLIGLIWGFIKFVRPMWRGLKKDFVKIRDALVGRDPIVDTITGKEIAPGLPDIGHRMATMEIAVSHLVTQNGDIADLKADRDSHAARIKKLEESALERAMSHAESAQAFKTIETAIKTPPPTQLD